MVQIWTLNGVPLIPSQDPNLSLAVDGNLTVLNSQEQYSGEYVCNVTTRFSFDLARVTVLIGSKSVFYVQLVLGTSLGLRYFKFESWGAVLSTLLCWAW